MNATIALGAQLLNFVTILIPVAFGRLESIAGLVFVGAVAAIACYTLSFAFPSVFPALRSPESRITSAVAAAYGLGLAVCVSAIGGAAALAVSPDAGGVILAISALILAQGVYVVGTSRVIQRGDHSRFARTRVFYALTNFSLTLIASSLFDWKFSLVAVAAVSFAIGGVISLRGDFRAGARAVRTYRDWSSLLRYLRENWAATLSNLLAGLSVQSGSLATGFLGSYAGVWGGIVRVSSGFAGIAQQVVAPVFEISLSRSIRERDVTVRQGIFVRTFSIGLVLAIAAIGAVFATSLFSSVLTGRSPALAPEALPIAAIYALGLITPAAGAKFLVMVGRQKAQLVLVVVKLATTLTALFVARGVELLFLLALVELVAAVAYILLLLGYARSRGVGDEPRVS